MRTGRGYVKVRKPKRFGTVLLLIAGGAAATAASAAITWASATGVDALRGPVDATASGGQVAPALVPLAAAAVAALGALVAAKGGLRRAVGAATMVLGIVVCWLGIRGLLHEPADVFFGPSASVAFPDVRIRPLGPAIGTAGGLALLVAGFTVLAGRIRARELGPRYDRTGASPQAAGSGDDPALRMWKELDGDRDPTVDLPTTSLDRADRPPGTGPHVSDRRHEGG